MQQNVGVLVTDGEDHVIVPLKTSMVSVYGTDMYTLMDLGAIENVSLKDMVKRLSVVPQETNN